SSTFSPLLRTTSRSLPTLLDDANCSGPKGSFTTPALSSVISPLTGTLTLEPPDFSMLSIELASMLYHSNPIFLPFFSAESMHPEPSGEQGRHIEPPLLTRGAFPFNAGRRS